MKANWIFERSFGYAGYRCQNCATWIYQHDIAICNCTMQEAADNKENEILHQLPIQNKQGQSELL